MLANTLRNDIVVCLLNALSACRTSGATDLPSPTLLNDQQIARIASERSSSVTNRLAAISWTESESDDGGSAAQRIVVISTDPQSLSGPALVEFKIGQNGKPRLKDEVFAAILDKGMGEQCGIVMYKYCHLDINPSTDVPKLVQTVLDSWWLVQGAVEFAACKKVTRYNAVV